MKLFIQSSTRALHCVQRFLSSNTATTTSKLNSINVKRFQHNYSINRLIESDLPIIKKLQANEIMEDTDWTVVRKDLVENYKLTETIVDSKIYDICLIYKRIDEAMRYFKFLEHNNYNISLALTGSYLETFHKKMHSITADDEEEIFRVYDDLRKKYPLLDGLTCKSCILALSLTKRWKDALELVDMMKISSNPGRTVISAITAAAFRNNEVKMGWTIMTESSEKYPLEAQVYKEYLRLCKNKFDKNKLQEELEKIMFFWGEHDVKPTEDVIMEYADAFKSLGFTVKYTSISDRGNCKYCNHKLQATTLSNSDFKVLSTSILKNLIVGKNVFHATSPQELKRYLIFVKTMKPYDVVIDGLNVVYACRNPKDPGTFQRLLNVVNYFYNAKKRVLVIGKAHMNWWSKDIMKAISEKADVFLTKNLSQDDPFLLHVSLLSGSGTYFVSRDLMRQHKFKLVDVNLQIMFRRWQLSRQYMFKTKPNNSFIKLIPPLPFEITAQKGMDQWHIPYTKNEDAILPEEFTIPPNWLCLTKQKY